jgi:hypothetical protein
MSESDDDEAAPRAEARTERAQREERRPPR